MNSGIENKPERRPVFIPCGDALEKMLGMDDEKNTSGIGADTEKDAPVPEE